MVCKGERSKWLTETCEFSRFFLMFWGCNLNRCHLPGSVVGRVSTSERPLANTRTSSTAQGGGGSFKNREPLGEVGCCESQMEERIH